MTLLVEKRYFSFSHLFLKTVLLALLTILLALTCTNCDFNISKKITTQSFNIQSRITPLFFIGFNENSSNISEEMICEERNDDETKESNLVKKSDSSDLFINAIKPTANLSSKEFAYYHSNIRHTTPVGLYILFCSSKTFLV